MGLPEPFSYSKRHGLVVCRECATCLKPDVDAWERHLRRKPHLLTGILLRSTIDKLQETGGCTVDGPESAMPANTDTDVVWAPIDGLATYTGFRCTHQGCTFLTRREETMKYEHQPKKHNKSARAHHDASPLWLECSLQTYFTAKGLIKYFLVSNEQPAKSTAAGLSAPEIDLFRKLDEDITKAEDDAERKGGVVQDFTESKSSRVPWLATLGFPAHLKGLKDDEIRSSYMLPPKRALGDCDGDMALSVDPILDRILAATEEMLNDAYELCSDTSPGRRMTQQRANILNEFYSGASSRSAGFRYFKNASTLRSYFAKTKQLLVYFYRVVHQEDGHFTREQDDQVLPHDTIVVTEPQVQAMDDITDYARQEPCAETDSALKHSIRRLYMALICHNIGSEPFRSPVLSFCAMLSRRIFNRRDRPGRVRCRTTAPGIWEEAGNYNSNLSALTWTAQLILFDYACFQMPDDDDDGVPDLLRKICRKFFQQLAEAPFGYILQWRLYLFAASKDAITKRQARWSLDGETIEFQGIELRMDQVSQLVASEHRWAHQILHQELLLGSADLVAVESWKLHDDLDRDEYGGSWANDARNAELLNGTDRALLNRIQGSPELRRTFVRQGPDGSITLCPKAIEIYEAHVQDFLSSMVLPCQVAAGPPVRAPELLSLTIRNTARPRHIFIWEKLVMLHIQYHKGQEQSGIYKDNIRFLRKADGDLLLTFQAYVQPLRQVFLRQSRPDGLLSPYLWSKLDGRIWKDKAVSACIRKACLRAQVPQFQTSWWRQVAASITKQKFAPRERANFDVEGTAAAADDIEDEVDLVHLAKMSNHSFHTFNHAYAGTTTLTLSTLLHRSYRASESWQNLFHFDRALPCKRKLDDVEPRMLLDCKRSRYRRHEGHTEAELIAAARRLYRDPKLRFRVPGQRRAMLATLGPRWSEQVVVVLATGSGKTMVAMVAATLNGTDQTTILILPTVALRGDMIVRLARVGIRPHIWVPGSSKSGPLVIVSAEAACTEGFMTYALRLCDRQKLAQIIVDECQLTVTASSYRESMSNLAWHVRQIRTQTIWLTATLPPVMEEDFIEHNKLIRPHVVRESTNRANIRYLVQRGYGLGSLVESAAAFVRSYRNEHPSLFNHSREKMIIYCRTKVMVTELAEALGCASYTADSGSDQDKDAIIQKWLEPGNTQAIVATAALGPGFDYAHVRLVIHVGAPGRLTDFSQESGRAGRDGRKAESIILLSAEWEPSLGGGLNPDEEAMQLFLSQKHCSRGVLSQFLDTKTDWRWCMKGEDEPCGVCREPQTSPRPVGLEFQHARPDAVETMFTGPAEVLRQDNVKDETLWRYKKDLEIMRGCCLYCRVQGRAFDHAATACSRRMQWIKAKQQVLSTRRKDGGEWIERYVVCWKCYQPQEICRVADPEVEEEAECRFPDMIIPLCYGAFLRPGRTTWFKKHFQRQFRDVQEYMIWLGKTTSLAGNKCVQANRVAALVLSELG